MLTSDCISTQWTLQIIHVYKIMHVMLTANKVYISPAENSVAHRSCDITSHLISLFTDCASQFLSINRYALLMLTLPASFISLDSDYWRSLYRHHLFIYIHHIYWENDGRFSSACLPRKICLMNSQMQRMTSCILVPFNCSLYFLKDNKFYKVRFLAQTFAN